MIMPELYATDFYHTEDENGTIYVYIYTDPSIEMLAGREEGEMACMELGLFTLVGFPYWRLGQHLMLLVAQLKEEYNRHPSPGR